jgi:hypothetical protein
MDSEKQGSATESVTESELVEVGKVSELTLGGGGHFWDGFGFNLP